MVGWLPFLHVEGTLAPLNIAKNGLDAECFRVRLRWHPVS